MSWNVYYSNNLVGRAGDVAAAIAKVDPEIASLQEMWREWEEILAQLNQQTPGKSWDFARGGATEKVWDGDILYRSDLWTLEDSGVRAYGERGISWAALRRRSDGAGIIAAGTHPWCCTNDKPVLQTVQGEIRPLLDDLRATYPGYPAALMGDMNAGFFSDSQALLRDGERSAHRRDWSIEPYSFEDSLNTDGNDPNQNTGFGPKIDFVYFERSPLHMGNVTGAKVWDGDFPNNGGSDHFAVSGDVVLSAGPGPAPNLTTSAQPTTQALAGAQSWHHHPERNCYTNFGARSIHGANPLPGTYTLAGCQMQCEEIAECECIVMKRGIAETGGSSSCWLRRSVTLHKCQSTRGFDTWVRGSAASPTVTPVSTSSSAAAATSQAPSSGSRTWQHHPGINCYTGHGAQPVSAADPLPGTFPLAQCKAQCEQMDNCVAVVMKDWVTDGGASPCWLRKSVELADCLHYPGFGTWVLV